MQAISVVIPSRDTAALTLACLASLENAAFPRLEILVVDDGSTDDTAEAIGERFPGVRVLRQVEPEGFTRTANRGLGEAQGEVLLLLNSDTEVAPRALEGLAAAFADDDRLGIAGARLVFPDGTPQWSGGAEPGLLWLFGLASGLPRLLGRLPGYRHLRPVSGTASPGGASSGVAWVTGAAFGLRRRVWQEVGPFDARFRFYAQDLDYCLRARAAGWEVRVLPEVEVRHHQGGTIGTVAGAAGGEHPELLWTDLLRWAAKHRGQAWAQRARRLMSLGARLRLVGRAVAGGWGWLAWAAGARRRVTGVASRARTAAFRAALASLSALDIGVELEAAP